MEMNTETGHSQHDAAVQVFVARKVLTMNAQQPEQECQQIHMLDKSSR